MGTPTLCLNRLGLKAFRSFVDETSIELPQTGLHLINAPSGHGKSSLVEALAFALDYSQFPATEHQSWPWLTEEPMQVELDFSVGGLPHSIRRGKKPALFVGEGDRSTALTSASTIAKRLPQVLGMKPEMLKALTYRPQRQRGLFLSFTDAEKKSFLTELLHLGQAEEEVERTQKAITALERDVELAQARADQARGAVQPEPQRPETESVAPLVRAVMDADAVAQELKQRVDTATIRLAGLKETQQRAWDFQVETHVTAVDAQETEVELAEREQFQPDPTAGVKLEKLKARLKVIQEGMRKLRAQHQADLQQARDDLDGHKQRLWDAEQRAAELPKLANQRNALLDAMDILKVAVCPTCRQGWVDDAAKKLLNEKTAQAEVLMTSIETAEHHQEDVARLRALVGVRDVKLREMQEQDPVPEKFYQGEREYQESLGALSEQQKNARQTFETEKRSRVTAAQAELRTLQARRRAAEAEALQPTDEMKELQQFIGEKTRDQHAADKDRLAAQAKLDAANQRSEMVLAQFDRDHAQWERERAAVAAEERKVATLNERLAAEQDFLGLVKSFLSLVFDETLQAVAAKANELLVGVPNVAGFTLDFTSERETKAGTVRQEIKPIVRKDGHDISLRSGCSGGQQAVIELATDLALAEVIAQRTAIYPGWLVLDEPFDGLGSADKEACMAVLARVAEERAIFVIDHAVEIKESFSSVIDIQHHDGRSSLA